MAILKPSPSAPINRATGMRQSSRASRPSGCGAIVSMRSATVNPESPGFDEEGADALRGHAAVGPPAARRRAREHARKSPRCRRSRSRSSGRSARTASPSSFALVSIAATSEPAFGSDSANAAMDWPAPTRGSHSERICSPPARESGALPSPCIAKAKSASPSWRASVSRTRQIERASNSVAAPPSAARRQCFRMPALPSAATSSRQRASTAARSTGCGRPARFARAQSSTSAARRRCSSPKNGHCKSFRRGCPSVPLEDRLLLRREGLVGAAEILALHAGPPAPAPRRRSPR